MVTKDAMSAWLPMETTHTGVGHVHALHGGPARPEMRQLLLSLCLLLPLLLLVLLVDGGGHLLAGEVTVDGAVLPLLMTQFLQVLNVVIRQSQITATT